MNITLPSSLIDDILTLPFEEQLSAIRRHLHRHPELGFREFETAEFLRQILKRLGLNVHGPIARTGLYVEIEGHEPGPAIGYRADIDALPIQDEKITSYASCVPGMGHLCGHDAHMTIALGVIRLVLEQKECFPGKIRFFFQPNEEGAPSGAEVMLREGIIDELEAVYAVHVDPTLPVGTFGLAAGPITAASDGFRIHVFGKGTGHGARPHQTVDTVWVTHQIITQLYQVIGRLTDARNPAVLTLCLLRGGTALNVIPAEVEIGGTLRTIDPDDRTFLKRKIVAIAEEIADLYGAHVRVEYEQGSPAVRNDPTIIKHVEEVITSIYGCGAIFQIPQPSMGSEDFAYYLEKIPGALIRVGTAGDEKTSYPLHHTHFDIDERALPLAARVMSEVLIQHLEKAVAHKL